MAKEYVIKGLDTCGLNKDLVIKDVEDLCDEAGDYDTMMDAISSWLNENWEAICHRDCKYFKLDFAEVSLYHAEKGVTKGIIIDGEVSDDDAFFIFNQRDADDWDEHSFSFEEDLDDAYVPKEDIIGKKLIDIVELIIDAIQDEYDRLYDIAEEKAMEDHHDRMNGRYDDEW